MRRVTLHGGPADGMIVELEGGFQIHVPVSPEFGVHDVAVYTADGLFIETREGRERDYPACPGCGGRTTRATWAGHCELAGCEIVMCAAGYHRNCVLAMHSVEPHP